MSENKIAKVPVASHGLHKHSYNYPWLSSMNFGNVMPCYINPLRKGERDNPHAGVFSQLMPIAHNAFATGRYQFKCVFVPYKLVWRPWYSFAEQTKFNSDGVHTVPGAYPFVSHAALSTAFLSAYCNVVTAPADTDIVFSTGVNQSTYYQVKNTQGRAILRILGALGCTPSFIDKDNSTINILPILCYLKAFSDYYFPNQYFNNAQSLVLTHFQERDTVDFTSECSSLLAALEIASAMYYENSVFDLAWDNPAAPSIMDPSQVRIPDVTDPLGDVGSVEVNNDNITFGTPAAIETAGGSLMGFTQYVVNALKSLSMWMKRNQLVGARLIDRFLVSRGISLSNDSARISYLLGKRNIEIQVSGVENNSDSNLGELAGRGFASSGNSPLSFDCKAEDDGILLVIVSAIPDANFPVYLDGFACREDFMDVYRAEFDKLGTSAVPSKVVCQRYNGTFNRTFKDSVFGFLNQYWDEVQERPRLLGDFALNSKGATQLSAYHTFRILPTGGSNPVAAAHSYDFVRMADRPQYQRLFYSEDQENLMLFLRWYGNQYKEKLPLGDSYEWDDDEMNRRVSVVIGGSQK